MGQLMRCLQRGLEGWRSFFAGLVRRDGVKELVPYAVQFLARTRRSGNHRFNVLLSAELFVGCCSNNEQRHRAVDSTTIWTSVYERMGAVLAFWTTDRTNRVGIWECPNIFHLTSLIVSSCKWQGPFLPVLAGGKS